MKVKIEAILEFETEEKYEQFLEESELKYNTKLKAYKNSPLRTQVAHAMGLNLCMSPHLLNNPMFSFETVDKLEVLPD